MAPRERNMAPCKSSAALLLLLIIKRASGSSTSCSGDIYTQNSSAYGVTTSSTADPTVFGTAVVDFEELKTLSKVELMDMITTTAWPDSGTRWIRDTNSVRTRPAY